MAEMETTTKIGNCTPEQLMARGAVELVCHGTKDCSKGCPLWTIDGDSRPVACFEYAIRYSAEVLKALGVEEGRYLTPAEQGKMVGDLLDKVGRLEAENERLASECSNLKAVLLERNEPKPAERMTRAACLDKAKACVTGQREQDYGKPEDNFAVIARLWSAYLDNRINQQLRELADLRAAATSIGSMDYSKVRVQSSGGGHATYTDIVHHIAALEEEINAEVDRYIDEKHAIIRQIQALKNPVYGEILYKHYVEYKRLEEIAVEMNYSYDHVRRLHGWALQDFERCHTMPHSPVVE